MSASLPARVDAERMVAGRRSFEGVLPVAELPRLVQALADDRGEVAYRLDFGTGALGEPRLHVRLHAGLALECQRTLETFVFPADVDTWLGLLADDRDMDSLPGDCEPLLLEDGGLSPRRVIEDELILVLPLVPTRPGSEMPEGDGTPPAGAAGDTGQAEAVTHPFADLRQLLDERARRR